MNMGKLDIKWTRFEVSHKHDIDRDAPYVWIFGILIDVARAVNYKTRFTRAPNASRQVPPRGGGPETPMAGKIGGPYFVITRPATWPNLGREKFAKGDWTTVPASLDISEPTTGAFVVGVVVVMWEKALTSTSTQQAAYDAAVETIDDFIGKQVDKAFKEAADGTGIDLSVSTKDTSELASLVKGSVTDVFKNNLNLVHDNYIGTDNLVISVGEGQPMGQHLDSRFVQFAKGLTSLFTGQEVATEYGLNGSITYTP
jgi:hypothetical protein